MVNLINAPVSRSTMELYQNRHLRQIEHAAKQWEARESKVKNNELRRHWLQRQDNHNYRSEYDRIRGELGNKRIPMGNRYRLQNREAELKALFSQGNV